MKNIIKIIIGITILTMIIWFLHPNYPNNWNKVEISDSRIKMENQIGKSLTSDYYDIKGDVYIYETFLGWYRLDIHSDTNENIGMINIKFYLGTKEHYKWWNLKNVVQHRV